MHPTYSPIAGSDESGNVFIPFAMTDYIPYEKWRMIATMVWQLPSEGIIRSVIIDRTGKVYVQWVQEVKDGENQDNESPDSSRNTGDDAESIHHNRDT